ncbi:MAG: transcriptional repressor [Planctomycetota bacterium]
MIATASPVDEIRSLFAERGLRCTKQRIEIYQALAGTDTHPTAEQLHQLMQDSCCPCISLATVYNTLEALCRADLCRRIPVPGSGTRYDAATDDHLHLITDDGAVVDVPSSLSRQLLDHIPQELVTELESALGVRIDRVDVQLIAG